VLRKILKAIWATLGIVLYLKGQIG